MGYFNCYISRFIEESLFCQLNIMLKLFISKGRALIMGGKLEGKTALVTGASRGFGAAIAVGLAKEGADVAVHYNTSESGALETASKVKNLGRDAIIVGANITEWEAIKKMVSSVMDHFGKIDLLVNNVGDVAPNQMSWRDIDEETIDRVLAVDIKGTMLMIHEVGLRMMEVQSGAIVNIGSHVVINGSPRAPQYAAGKYGIIGLTKSYAHAFAPHIRVNAIGPGFIETETTLNREDWKTGRRQKVLDATPLKKIPRSEDLVDVVTFLGSEESRFMTGTFIVCNGGYSMVGA
jgi:NAD(P)-dependent dehydrogenase (short-subunit alcohol dehydrogenase family)